MPEVSLKNKEGCKHQESPLLSTNGANSLPVQQTLSLQSTPVSFILQTTFISGNPITVSEPLHSTQMKLSFSDSLTLEAT